MSLSVNQLAGFGAKRIPPQLLHAYGSFIVGATGYSRITGSISTPNATEALTQTHPFCNGAVTQLGVKVESNTISGGTVIITLRKNGADTVFRHTINPGDSGVFVISAAVVFSESDLWNWSVERTHGSGSVTVGAALAFERSSGLFLLSGGGQISVGSTSPLYISPSEYFHSFAVTLPLNRLNLQFSGTIVAAQFLISANAKLTNSTLTVYKNGLATGAVLTVPATTSGIFQASAGLPLSVVSGDDIALEVSVATLSSDLLRIDYCGFSVDGAQNEFQTASRFVFASQFTGGIRYLASTVTSANSSTPPATGSPIDQVTRRSKLRAYFATNGTAGDILISSQLDGVSGALSVTVPAGLTGWFFDTSENDDRVPARVNYYWKCDSTGAVSGFASLAYIVHNIEVTE